MSISARVILHYYNFTRHDIFVPPSLESFKANLTELDIYIIY